MTTMTPPNQLPEPAPQTPTSTTDPLSERLLRLNQRREAGISTNGRAAPEHKPPNNRRRPARGAKAVAFALSFAATGGLTYYFSAASLRAAQSQAFAALPVPISVQPAATATAPSTTAAEPTQPTPAPSAPVSTAPAITSPVTPAPTAVAAFNGAIVDTRYGPLQVQAQITNGTLTDVAVIQYPNGDGQSVDINRVALPKLRTAALTAQSAQVDTVSGATYTTDGYQQSLQSALDQARAAGVTTLA